MKNRNSLVLVHFLFIVSISQEEISVCSTAFKYQLATFLLASLIAKRVDLQKSKMEL